MSILRLLQCVSLGTTSFLGSRCPYVASAICLDTTKANATCSLTVVLDDATFVAGV
jgi:hypothetical protein